MNLASASELCGGGPGSGCHGPNCGRPREYHVIQDAPESSYVREEYPKTYALIKRVVS